MNQLKLFLIGLTALCCVLGSASGEKIINCYWGTWAHYRPGYGAFKAENIDPNLCTHLSYTFFGIDTNGNLIDLDKWLNGKDGVDNIGKAMKLKEINPKLKVMLVIGGWNEGSAKYSQMAADAAKRKQFVSSVLKFIDEHKFDGLDLDWEYPARNEGSNPADKQNFLILLQEIYQALHARGLLFGIAVGASGETAEISYQLPEISKYLDFINVMTYDFATWEAGVMGFNAPLRGQGANNVESAIKFWLSKGVPANKLVLGLAFYGHSFKLQNSQQYRGGARTNGPGAQGPITQTNGHLGYNEICSMKNSYEYEWSDVEGVPILHNSNEVISYDDEKSIALKVKLANELDLAGVMIWSIETDDFNGLCGTKNPLLKTVNINMGKPQDLTPSKNKGLVDEKFVAPKPVVPNNPNQNRGSGDCSADGLYPHKSDCTMFIQCAAGVPYDKSCPAGLHFDASSRTCNWPALANCN